MIKAGDKIDTSREYMVVQDGRKAKQPLSDLLHGPTLISVYMKNNTSACDKQIVSLVENADALQERGIRLIGLSKDTGGSHLKYAEAKEIPFPLISDPDKSFAQQTDSLVQKSMYGRKYLAPSRSAYLLDAEGVILGVIEKVDAPNHARQVMDLLDEKSGDASP